jgi:hypothetical protein
MNIGPIIPRQRRATEINHNTDFEIIREFILYARDVEFAKLTYDQINILLEIL